MTSLSNVQRRRRARLVTDRNVGCRTIATPYVVTLMNMSRGGCSLGSSDLQRGETVLLDLPSVGTIPGQIIWSDGRECGVRFHRELAFDEVDLLTQHAEMQVPFRREPTAPSRSKTV